MPSPLRLVPKVPVEKPKRKADPWVIARKRLGHLKGVEVVKSPLAWKGGNFQKWDR